MAKEPAVATQFAVYGFDLIGNANKPNAATMYVDMKDWSRTYRQRRGRDKEIVRCRFTVAGWIGYRFQSADHPWAG